jgi:hypothetical protein
MQAFLLNFGDNTRVVSDSKNVAVSIGIGELKECDIHDVHYHMIRRAVAKETLLVVPKEVKRTERLNAIMTLMRELMTEPYEDVLAKYNLLGDDDPEHVKIRPTREQMRHQLKDIARQEVATALRLQSKVNIREEGDEVTRKPATPPTEQPEVIKVPEQPPPQVIESPDRIDKAPRVPVKKATPKEKKASSKPKNTPRKRERL